MRCQSCGAPINEMALDGVCDYCGSRWTSRWTLNDIRVMHGLTPKATLYADNRPVEVVYGYDASLQASSDERERYKLKLFTDILNTSIETQRRSIINQLNAY